MMNNIKKLIERNRIAVKVFREMLKIKEQKNIDFYNMPDSELDVWVRYLMLKEKEEKT
jgi:hypothetical protein